MAIHDWTRVDAGIFHHFHQRWIGEISGILNRGLLPQEYYALAEQVAGNVGPDVLTLRIPSGTPFRQGDGGPTGGVAVADAPPCVRFHVKAEDEIYAGKADAIVIRHTSAHDVVAILEIVSPGNKGGRRPFTAFVEKAQEAIAAGIHLLVVDLFPPTKRDPQGIHPAIWDGPGGDFAVPDDKPLTCAAYIGGPMPEAFVEPVAVGDALPDMPLFLTPDVYVPVPLEAAYQAAWDDVPAFWRAKLSAGDMP